MSGRYLPTCVLLLFFTFSASADLAKGDPRLERLFGSFIAPCCWRENLLVHHSPKADDLRKEIRSLVAKGQTDEAIQSQLVGEYSRRILAMPDGQEGQWLSIVPWIAAAFGVFFVAWTIRRNLRHPQPSVPDGIAALPELDLD